MNGAFDAGIPKHDTIARVICRLKADEIEHAFQSWILSLIETRGADIIAIDGKTARRLFTTKDRKSALHTASAWSCQHQLVLGQTAVDSKTNEITAIPELLTMLNIENSIIALDAMGCQQETRILKWLGYKSPVKQHIACIFSLQRIACNLYLQSIRCFYK